MAQTKSGSVARAPIRRPGRRASGNSMRRLRRQLSSVRWTIMPLTEGAGGQCRSGVRTWSEYRAALDTLNRGAATWQMVPTHELAA